MPGTYIDTTDPATVKRWAKDVWAAVPYKTILFNPSNRWTSSEGTNLIHVFDDLKKGPGDDLTFDLIQFLGGSGVVDEEIVEGKEEPIKVVTDSFKVGITRHGVALNGALSQQRVPFDIMKKSTERLVEWWAQRLEARAMIHLAYYAAGPSNLYREIGGAQIDGTSEKFTGKNAIRVPDANHIYYVNGNTTDAQIAADSQATLDVDIMDALVEIASTGVPPMRPIMWEGEGFYFYFYHPSQDRHIRRPGTIWFETAQNQLRQAQAAGNPLVKGGTFLWNNVIGVKHPLVPPGFTGTTAITNVFHNVFCGAQALAFGMASCYPDQGAETGYELVSATWDGGDKKNLYLKNCSGLLTPRFKDRDGTTRDYGRIVVPLYSDPVVAQAA